MKNENNYKCYSLNISNKFLFEEQSRKKLKNIYQLVKRCINYNEKFNNISFIIGISNTKKQTAIISYIRTNKRGRPKKIVKGEKILWHIHLYFISNTDPVSLFCDVIKTKLVKKGFIISKNINYNAENAINYVKIQSQSYWTYGKYFKSQNSNKKSAQSK